MRDYNYAKRTKRLKIATSLFIGTVLGGMLLYTILFNPTEARPSDPVKPMPFHIEEINSLEKPQPIDVDVDEYIKKYGLPNSVKAEILKWEYRTKRKDILEVLDGCEELGIDISDLNLNR